MLRSLCLVCLFLRLVSVVLCCVVLSCLASSSETILAHVYNIYMHFAFHPFPRAQFRHLHNLQKAVKNWCADKDKLIIDKGFIYK